MRTCDHRTVWTVRRSDHRRTWAGTIARAEAMIVAGTVYGVADTSVIGTVWSDRRMVAGVVTGMISVSYTGSVSVIRAVVV